MNLYKHICHVEIAGARLRLVNFITSDSEEDVAELTKEWLKSIDRSEIEPVNHFQVSFYSQSNSLEFPCYEPLRNEDLHGRKLAAWVLDTFQQSNSPQS